LASFALFCQRFSFWSRDIIFLVTDGSYAGTLSWLEAYHGKSSSSQSIISSLILELKYEKLNHHSGSIISAINVEFHSVKSYASIGLHPVGVNGRLPNADLVTTVLRSFQYSGMSVRLGKHGHGVNDQMPWIHNYPLILENLIGFMKNQAFGFPLLNHGLFALYNIEALSVSGVDGDYEDITLSKIGL
jgi:glycosylphosphatidylinositol transamidase